MKHKWGVSLGAFGFVVILMFVGVFGEKLFNLASNAIRRDFTGTPSGITQQDDVYIITFLLEDGRTLILRLNEDALAELKKKLEARKD